MLSVLGAASSIIMHGLALWWQATVMATSSMKCTVHKYIGLWFKIPSCLIRDILFTVKYMSRLQKPELIRNAKELYSLSSLKCHSCYIVQCWPTPLITAVGPVASALTIFSGHFDIHWILCYSTPRLRDHPLLRMKCCVYQVNDLQ